MYFEFKREFTLCFLFCSYWSKESFAYFDRILFSEEGARAGIFQASGYQVFNDVRQDPTYKDHIYSFRHLTEDDLKIFPEKYKYGYFSTTLCVDARRFMKYLTEKYILIK